jgi:hypothetical protein
MKTETQKDAAIADNQAKIHATQPGKSIGGCNAKIV